MKWDFIKSLSHLVVIGNTNHELIASLLALSPAKTTLFAADEAQSKQLKKYTTNDAPRNTTSSNVAIKQVLIATAKQRVDWYQYNLPQLNAVTSANKTLVSLFPSLKLQQKSELETTDVAAELKTLNLSGKKNMLLLNAPVQNLALLQRLTETELLSEFPAVVVQHTSDMFYQGIAGVSEITGYLIEQGYQLLKSDQTDPDFPILQFYRDAAGEALKQSQFKIKELTALLAVSQQQLTELRSELNSTKVALRDGTKFTENQLAETIKQLKQTQLDNQEFSEQNHKLSQRLKDNEKENQLLLAEKQSQLITQNTMMNELKLLKVELKNMQDALGKKESEKEFLALKNLNLINENESLLKVNESLRSEIQKIDVQMDLLKELIKLPD